MATAQTRAYFTATPQTSEYDRFSSSNIPSQDTFEDLFASLFFKEEEDDMADVGNLGVVEITSDNDALSRTTAGDVPYNVVLPHHLPLLMADTAEVAYGDSEVHFQGLTYEVIEGSATGRASFKITFTPVELTTVTAVSADYVVISDVTDGKPKKALISDIISAGTTIWQKISTTISPATANDSVDIGTGTYYGANMVLDSSSDRSILVDVSVGATGADLIIQAGGAVTNGGELNLTGGAASDGRGVGGDVFLYGGTGPGKDGDTYACWDGSTIKGVMAIGGTSDTDYMLKVYGDVLITEGLTVETPGTDPVTIFSGFNASYEVQSRTLAEFHVDLFTGPANAGDMLVDDGTNFVRLTPGAEGEVLIISSSVPAWGTVSGLADEKVAVTGETAGYLEDVLVEGAVGGINLTVSGATLTADMDIYDLQDLSGGPSSVPSRTAYIALTDEYDSNKTKKVKISALIGGADSGWTELVAGTDFDNDTTNADEITTIADLRSVITPGMALKYLVTGDGNPRYGVVSAITNNLITLAGDPLTLGVDYIGNLYYGGQDKVINKTYVVNTVAYNSLTTTKLLEDKTNIKEGDRWTSGPAKLVKFEVIHMADDTGTAPNINIRVGSPLVLGQSVSTSNTNEGIPVTTTLNSTGIDINPSNNTIEYGDNLEICVVDNGNADADYLTVYVTFVKK